MLEIIDHYIETPGEDRLYMAELPVQGPAKEPLLFIHGALENGRVFYTEKGKGLAPYLQKRGHPCFILDLRGRGRSTPPLSRNSTFGQFDYLDHDIPEALRKIKAITGAKEISFVSHSWGGVLVNSFLLKSPTWIPEIKSLVHVSVKRRVSVFNIHRLFYIDLMWAIVGTLFLWIKGHLPKNAFGPEGESYQSLKDSQRWVYSKAWMDKEHGLDYPFLARQHNLPRALYLTGKRDHCLGHIQDVTNFALESGHSEEDIHLLSREKGNARDYGHVDILTAKEAKDDHFPMIADFLAKN